MTTNPTALQKVPNGTAAFSNYGTNQQLVSGFTDELFPQNRDMYVRFTGAVAADNQVSSTSNSLLTLQIF